MIYVQNVEKMIIKNGYFVTYVSTSWSKNVSKAFMKGNKGMIIEFDKEYRTSNHLVHCCDLEFPNFKGNEKCYFVDRQDLCR